MCYDAQKRFRDISQALSPTHRLDLDASWIFETTFCAPSPTGWGGLSGLGWPESVPNQENGACSAWKGRGTITDNIQPHPQPMVQLIESEIRCLSLLLRLDISNLRFFESFSLFFPHSNTSGQQLPHLVLVRKNRKTDVFNFQTASQIYIGIIWSGTHLDVSLPMSDLDSMILSPPHSVILQSW